MAYPTACWWCSTTFSDFTLHLVTKQQGPESQPAADNSITALPLHRVVIAGASTYFRARLTQANFKDTHAPDAAPLPIRSASPDTTSDAASDTSSPSSTGATVGALHAPTTSAMHARAASAPCAVSGGQLLVASVSEGGMQPDSVVGDSLARMLAAAGKQILIAGEAAAAHNTQATAPAIMSHGIKLDETETPISTSETAAPSATSEPRPEAGSGVRSDARSGVGPQEGAGAETEAVLQVEASGTLLLTENIAAEQRMAALAVLEHCYKGGEAVGSAMLLAQMCQLAGYWCIDSTCNACLQALCKLAAASQITTDIFPILGIIPDEQLQTAQGEALLRQLCKCVETHYGPTSGFPGADDPICGALFLKLPFVMIKHWAGLAGHDHEHVVAALDAWVNVQEKCGRVLSTEQCIALSGQVRLSQLSTNYHAPVMHRLPWYKPPPILGENHLALRMLCQRNPESVPKKYRDALECSNPRSKVCASTQTCLNVSWEVLQQLWNWSLPQCQLPDCSMAGYRFHTYAQFQPHKDGGKTLALYIANSYAAPSLHSIHPVACAKLTINVVKSVPPIPAFGNMHSFNSVGTTTLCWAGSGEAVCWSDILGVRLHGQQDLLKFATNVGGMTLTLDITNLQ